MAQKKQYKSPAKLSDKKKDHKVQPAVQGKPKKNIRDLSGYFIFFFAVLLYSNTLLNQYVLDDKLMITENNFTKKGFAGIGDILTTDSFVGFFGKQENLVAGGRYRPLSHITFAMEYGIFGLNPFVGHLINILLYALSCLLVFKVLKMLIPAGRRQWYLSIPFIATMLFAAHPLHTEVVANIKGRDEIMSLLGSFGALYFVLKYIENTRLLNLLAASIIFFLALMSKENASTFILIIPLTLYFFTTSSLKKTLVASASMVAMFVVFVIIRSSVMGFLMSNTEGNELLNSPFLFATTPEKIATILLTWGKYLLLLIFPHPLTYDYYPKQIPIIEMSDIRAIVPLLVYLFLAVYAIIRIKKKDIVAYGILFFGITFSISSNLVFPIGTFMSERFMFVPLLGFCLVLAWLLPEKMNKLFSENVSRSLVLLVIGIILLGYTVKTIARNPAWKNNYSLATTDVKVSFNSAKCNAFAGEATMDEMTNEKDPAKKKKMVEDAVKYLTTGVEIYPKYQACLVLMSNAMLELANIYEKQGQIDSVINIMNRCLIKDPRSAPALHKLGEVYGKNLNNIDKSIEYMLKAYEITPDEVSLLENLGIAYGIKRDYPKSVEFFTKAIAINPGIPKLYRNLSETYLFMGETQKAAECKEKAKQLESAGR